jgi:hypothetical protein
MEVYEDIGVGSPVVQDCVRHGFGERPLWLAWKGEVDVLVVQRADILGSFRNCRQV